MKSDYSVFLEKVKTKTGIDLSFYKEQQMKRRLTSLSTKNGYPTLTSFYSAMEKDRKTMDMFLSHMTINVSEFYRNRSQWKILGETILPLILNGKSSVKVWSAACSTGEEPYSLATLLSQHVKPPLLSILATDLDQAILNQATVGLYPENALKELTKEEKDRFFVKSGTSYQIADEYKRMVSFKKHNLLADRYQRNFDLIVCRNVLIYFTEEAKDEVIHKFSQSLKPGGVLFLGSTERINNPGQYGLKPISSFFFQKE